MSEIKRRDKTEKIYTDKDFEDANVSMESDTYIDLVNSMKVYGFKKHEPILTWIHKGKEYVVDGHHRYRAKTDAGLDEFFTMEVEELKGNPKEEVKAWITEKQLSTKTVSPLKEMYLQGLRYHNEKNTRGGDRKTNLTKEGLINTAKSLGKKYGKSDTYFENAGRLVTRIRSIAGSTGRKANDCLNILETITNVELISKLKQEDQKAIFDSFEANGNTETIGNLIKQYIPESRPKGTKNIEKKPSVNDGTPEIGKKPDDTEKQASDIKENVEDDKPVTEPITSPTIEQESEVKPNVPQTEVGLTGGDVLLSSIAIESNVQEIQESQEEEDEELDSVIPTLEVESVLDDEPETEHQIVLVKKHADFVISETVTMNIVRICPERFKRNEDSNFSKDTLKVDVFIRGNPSSCYIYHHKKERFAFCLPNVEYTIFDFSEPFGITATILQPDPDVIYYRRPYTMSFETWNNVVRERFPDLLIEENAAILEPVKAPETPKVELVPKEKAKVPVPAEELIVEAVIRVSPVAEKPKKAKELESGEPKRDYTKDKEIIRQLIPTIDKNGISVQELIDKTGRREDYDNADEKGIHAIEGTYQRFMKSQGFVSKKVGNGYRYVKVETVTETAYDLVIKAIANDGIRELELVELIHTIIPDALEKEIIETLETTGKIVRKITNDNILYYPSSATV